MSIEERLAAILERVAAELRASVAASEPRASAAGPTDDLLSHRDVCALLGLGDRTFRRMRAGGEGPKSVRVGTRERWRRADVDRWLEDKGK
jgi:excisionase family DNA binding protein